MYSHTSILFLLICSLSQLVHVSPYDYAVPLCSSSPWPQMRGNSFQNARANVFPLQVRANWSYWRFQTQGMVFSVPVIGPNGTSVLIGSSDFNFYSLNSTSGDKIWSYETGNIIDSAACVDDQGVVRFGSGDGHLYSLDVETGEKLDAFASHHMKGQPDEHRGKHCSIWPPEGGFSLWFEGNANVGPSGIILAGADDFRLYGLNVSSINGTLVENFAFYGGPLPFGVFWSAPATNVGAKLSKPSLFFGTMGAVFYSIDAETGDCNWSRWLLGPISSSPTVSSNGNVVYVGCWGGYLYALDTATGKEIWNFKTRNIVYSSPALSPNEDVVYISSVDGSLYAILTSTGRMQWTWDTLNPIQSSPAVAADGSIYVGGGDGVLYALSSVGKRRWSYDTTLAAHNTSLSSPVESVLNSSPALGNEGVYIGSSDGSVWGIQYNYCTKQSGEDQACSIKESSDLPDTVVALYWVTPTSKTLPSPVTPVPSSTVITVRLIIRQNATTLDCSLIPNSVTIETTPIDVDFEVLVQSQGEWVNLVPTHGFLPVMPHLQLSIKANYSIAGTDTIGSVSNVFILNVTNKIEALPAADGKVDPNQMMVGDTFELLHLAPYQPPVIVSLNQIGFDSLYQLATVVYTDGNYSALWLTTGKRINDTTYPDESTTSMLALDMLSDGDSLTMIGQYYELITGGPPIKLQSIRLGGLLIEDGSFAPSSGSILGRASCYDLGPTGWALLLDHLCNHKGEFISVGSVNAKNYSQIISPPIDLTVASTHFSTFPHTLTVFFNTSSYMALEHLVSIVALASQDIKNEKFRVVPIDYQSALLKETSPEGLLKSVTLKLPESFSITKFVVVADQWPMYETEI